ncbi:MAG TPA: hypothetical protein VH084_29790, partial [Mycobacterium sp.]|nr:hypothetical protein [Mycobacterium sp.]
MPHQTKSPIARGWPTRDTCRTFYGDDLLRRALDTDLPDDETAARILTAAFDQAEDFGLRRFTMDDVARRVG